MLGTFPLMALVIIICNALVYLTGIDLAEPVFNVALVSGAIWTISVNDIIVFIGLVLLFLELIGATRTGAATIVNHALSMLVLLVALIEFIVLPQFGHTTFFLLVLLTLFDVIAGFTVTITAARRDFTVGE